MRAWAMEPAISCLYSRWSTSMAAVKASARGSAAFPKRAAQTLAGLGSAMVEHRELRQLPEIIDGIIGGALTHHVRLVGAHLGRFVHRRALPDGGHPQG